MDFPGGAGAKIRGKRAQEVVKPAADPFRKKGAKNGTMQFDQEFIDHVRSSLSIVNLVSGYVSLKKSGQNHAGLCPFHRDTTPSFLVSESKQIFKCFGCGEGGDVFAFISRIENVSFPEAVRYLAERSGIPLPVSGSKAPGQGEDRRKLLDIMKRADRFFRQCLAAPQGQPAADYLQQRRLTPQTVETFGLGFAPIGNRLWQHLHEAGVPEEDALTCGLIKEGEGGQLYDRFRGRIVFPIRDLTGATIAFGGRVLGDGIPKYLNSPETPLYHKSNHLFGLDQSRNEIRRCDFAILVEGYFDCVVPYQFGFRNIVASLGTALTEQQVRILGRYTRNVIISYDPDSAGMSAAVRSIDLFLKEGFRVNIVELPPGVDPDTYIRQKGEAAYQQLLRSSIPCLDFVMNRLMEQQKDPFSPRGKQEIANGILPFLAKIPNQIERAEHLSRIATRIQIEEGLLRLEMRKLVSRNRQTSHPLHSALIPRVTSAESTLLQAVLLPEQAEQVLALLDQDLFAGLRTEAIFDKVLQLRELNRQISILYLRDLIERDEDRDLLETLGFETPGMPIAEENIKASVSALRRKQYERLSRQIQEEISKEEASDSGSSRIEELLARKEEIRRKIELDLS